MSGASVEGRKALAPHLFQTGDTALSCGSVTPRRPLEPPAGSATHRATQTEDADDWVPSQPRPVADSTCTRQWSPAHSLLSGTQDAEVEPEKEAPRPWALSSPGVK